MWFSHNGPSSSSEFDAVENKELFTQRSRYRPMAHQQKLKRSRTLESKGLHLLVHAYATKKQKLVKALTKEKRLNGVRSVVLEEMVELDRGPPYES